METPKNTFCSDCKFWFVKNIEKNIQDDRLYCGKVKCWIIVCYCRLPENVLSSSLTCLLIFGPFFHSQTKPCIIGSRISRSEEILVDLLFYILKLLCEIIQKIKKIK